MNRTSLRFAALFSVVVLMGFGCGRTTPPGAPTESTGPQPATFTSLSPKEASRKLNLVSSNVIRIHQSFTGDALNIAHAMGWGDAATTTAVVKSFAPGHRGNIEWKRDTVAASGTKMVNEQFAGAIADAELQSSHGFLSPTLWQEGTHEGLASGVLWVSQDAYENFTRSKSGTFSFDLVEPEFMNVVTSAELKKGLVDLKAKVDAAIARKDVYLAKADDPSEWTLKLNGVDTKVQVVKVTSWFGTVVFLDNPQNALVLQVRTDPTVMGKLGNVFDYDVTSLDGLIQ